MRTTFIIALFMLAGGCASTPPENNSPPPVPAPSNFSISGTTELNLTPQLCIETGLPPSVKATLDAEAKSEVVGVAPLHSHHEGHMKLVVTDADGKHTFANISLTVKGDSEGSPTEGLWQVVSHFLDAAAIMSRPIPQATGSTQLNIHQEH